MPFAKLKTELLAARTRRQSLLLQHLPADAGCLLQLSLNIPGADKEPRGAVGLYRWGERQISERFAGLQRLLTETDLLGPWGLFASSHPASQAKRATIAIEESRNFARLLDIDVYDAAGRPCDRHQLGLKARTCLICSEPANECVRLQRHSFPKLKECLEELLKPFAT